MFGYQNVSVDMDKEIMKMIDRFDEDITFRSYMCSVLDNFKEHITIEDPDQRLMLSVFVGWIAGQMFENIKTRAITKDILENDENIADYEFQLDDGSTMIITTNDDRVIDNLFIKELEEKIGKKVVSSHRILDKKESKKLHEKVVKKIEKDGLEKL